MRHDVGTLTEASGKHLGEPLEGIDTPTTLGVWDTAPYFHDGSAATLLEVVTRHGDTEGLSGEQLNDLVQYLLSFGGSPDEIPAAAEPPPHNDDNRPDVPGTGASLPPARMAVW